MGETIGPVIDAVLEPGNLDKFQIKELTFKMIKGFKQNGEVILKSETGGQVIQTLILNLSKNEVHDTFLPVILNLLKKDGTPEVLNSVTIGPAISAVIKKLDTKQINSFWLKIKPEFEKDAEQILKNETGAQVIQNFIPNLPKQEVGQTILLIIQKLLKADPVETMMSVTIGPTINQIIIKLNNSEVETWILPYAISALENDTKRILKSETGGYLLQNILGKISPEKVCKYLYPKIIETLKMNPEILMLKSIGPVVQTLFQTLTEQQVTILAELVLSEFQKDTVKFLKSTAGPPVIQRAIENSSNQFIIQKIVPNLMTFLSKNPDLIAKFL